MNVFLEVDGWKLEHVPYRQIFAWRLVKPDGQVRSVTKEQLTEAFERLFEESP